jgi:hypothetical protein
MILFYKLKISGIENIVLSLVADLITLVVRMIMNTLFLLLGIIILSEGKNRKAATTKQRVYLQLFHRLPSFRG